MAACARWHGLDRGGIGEQAITNQLSPADQLDMGYRYRCRRRLCQCVHNRLCRLRDRLDRVPVHVEPRAVNDEGDVPGKVERCGDECETDEEEEDRV